MKTLNSFTAAMALLTFNCASGQTFKLLDQKTNANVTGINIYEHTTSEGSSESNLYDITNLASSTQTFVINKYILSRNIPGPGDSANIYFCTGLNCYTPPQMSATFTLPASGTMTLRFDMDEASVVGKSKVRYRLQNQITTGDSVVLVFDYNKTLGLKQAHATEAEISSLFPNPCQHYFDLYIYSLHETEALVKIVDASGKTAHERNVTMSPGRNSQRIETAELPRGIYSLIISTNEGFSVKQFAIE